MLWIVLVFMESINFLILWNALFLWTVLFFAESISCCGQYRSYG